MELRTAELLKEVESGRARPVYYLLGEEKADRDAAADRIKAAVGSDDFNFRAFTGDLEAAAPAILAEVGTLPMFSARRLVLVKAPAFPAALKKALAGYLREPCPSTTLVLVSDDRRADPKDALMQAAGRAGALCVFSALREDEARARLKAAAKRAGKTLSDEAAAALVREAGTQWGVLAQELQKALLFSSSAVISAEQALECLGYRKAADPFALSRLIQERRTKEALAHLGRFLKDGKPQDQAFRALAQMSAAVSKSLRAKMLQRAGAAPAEIFRALRLHSYWDRGFLADLARVGESRLEKDLRLCLKTEARLKSQSWLDPAAEVERLAVELCRGGKR